MRKIQVESFTDLLLFKSFYLGFGFLMTTGISDIIMHAQAASVPIIPQVPLTGENNSSLASLSFSQNVSLKARQIMFKILLLFMVNFLLFITKMTIEHIKRNERQFWPTVDESDLEGKK